MIKIDITDLKKDEKDTSYKQKKPRPRFIQMKCSSVGRKPRPRTDHLQRKKNQRKRSFFTATLHIRRQWSNTLQYQKHTAQNLQLFILLTLTSQCWAIIWKKNHTRVLKPLKLHFIKGYPECTLRESTEENHTGDVRIWKVRM